MNFVFTIGNIAVARSYVSAATNEKERSTAMSALSSMQGLGFILGPGTQLICSLIYVCTTYKLSPYSCCVVS